MLILLLLTVLIVAITSRSKISKIEEEKAPKTEREVAYDLFRDGKFKEAINLYEKIEQETKDPSIKREIREEIAHVYISVGNNAPSESEKIAVFEKIINEYPDTQSAHRVSMWVPDHYFKVKDYKKAIPYYQKVIERYPQDKRARWAFGKIVDSYLQQGDYKQALTVAKNFTKEYPQSGYGLFKQLDVAEEYAQIKQYQKSLKICYDILEYTKQHPKFAQAIKINIYPKMQETYLAMGKPEEAIKVIQQGIDEKLYDSEKELAMTYEQMAIIHRRTKNYDQALKVYQTIMEKFPRNKPIHYKAQLNAANMHFKIGNLEEAIRIYQDVIAKYPRTSYSQRAFGAIQYIYAKQGRYDEALKVANEALRKGEYKEDEDIASQLYDVAGLYLAKGDTKIALEKYQEIISKYPDTEAAKGADTKVIGYYMKNEPERAISLAQNRLARAKDFQTKQWAYIELESAYLKTEKHKEFLETFKKMMLDLYQIEDVKQIETTMATDAYSQIIEAEKRLLKIIDINKDSITNLLAAGKEVDKASKQEFIAGMKAPLITSLAKCYEKINDWEKSIFYYQSAIEIYSKIIADAVDNLEDLQKAMASGKTVRYIPNKKEVEESINNMRERVQEIKAKHLK